MLGDGFSAKQKAALRDAARSGNYQLLLGAGASAGAWNARGPLPMAAGLVELLAAKFSSAPIPMGTQLPRAYQRAVSVSDTSTVWYALKAIFADADHNAWFNDMSVLPWRRVWTLNIDDAFERAYRTNASDLHPTLETVSWDEDFAETKNLQVIHLHGHVIGKDPRPLVFSFSEYAKAAQQRPVWDQVLGGILASTPFVVLGARILDDPDIEALLLNNPKALGTPSLIVDPYISEDNAWELERIGYTIVKATGEEFLKQWISATDLENVDIGSLFRDVSLRVPQMRRLATNNVESPPRGHNYFGGDAPLWSDAVHGHIAYFSWMDEALKAHRTWREGSVREPVFHIIYADRFTGASSGLLNILKSIKAESVDVYILDKSSRFDVDSIIDLCAGRGVTVIGIDGAADFADDLDRLMNKAADRDDFPLYVFAGEVPNNDLRLEGRLSGKYERTVSHVSRHLQNRDANRLIDKLRTFGRLGSLELENAAKQRQHFRGRDVFSSMLDVERSTGFLRRVDTEIDTLTSRQIDLLLLLGLASVENRQVSIVEASLATGGAASEIVREVAEHDGFSALVEPVGILLRARQRDKVLQSLLPKMGESTSLNKVSRMIRNLESMGSRRNLQERNRGSLLIGHLMTVKLLTRFFPREDLNQFYEGLRETFGPWNGRYWEQRAIYCKRVNDWGQAESYAGRAVMLYDSALTRTTYGTILINRSALFSDHEDLWLDYYGRGYEQFKTALTQSSENRVTHFAYLTATLDLAASLTRSTSSDAGPTASVQMVISDWTATYAQLRISLQGQEHMSSITRAEELSAKWTRLVVAKNS